MRISDWSSDVCSSDLNRHRGDRLQLSQEPIRFHRRRFGATIGDHLLDIFLGDVTKVVRRLESCGQLFSSPLGCRIEALGALLPGYLSLPSGRSQPNFGITTPVYQAFLVKGAKTKTQ